MKQNFLTTQNFTLPVFELSTLGYSSVATKPYHPGRVLCGLKTLFIFFTLYDSVHLHDVRFSFKIELWKFEGSTRKYTNGKYLFVDILWPDQIACGDE